MVKEAAENFLKDNMETYLKKLQDMVNINSYTLNVSGIDILNDYTTSLFKKLGFEAIKVKSSFKQYGNHLILEKWGTLKKTIGFISHSDTVYSAEEERENNFYWKRAGDKIFGPGTVDIKGGTMMIFIVLELLQTFHRDLYDKMNFTILLDCAEEVGGADFKDVCRRFLPLNSTLGCLVFEGCKIYKNQHYKVVSRKGMATFSIDVSGRSSHSGTAHKKGANSIVQASRLVEELHLMTDHLQGTTVNVGRIEGGTVRNRVADKCSLQLEMRASHMGSYNIVVQQIESLENKNTVASLLDGWKCQIQVNKDIVTQPWERNAGSDKLFQIWFKAAGSLGIPLLEEMRGGLSDGNLLWQNYAVIDGLGPGGANSHCSQHDPENGKEQEYLTISSITPVALINTYSIIEMITMSLSGTY